jgi:hypothetical protein
MDFTCANHGHGSTGVSPSQSRHNDDVITTPRPYNKHHYYSFGYITFVISIC